MLPTDFSYTLLYHDEAAAPKPTEYNNNTTEIQIRSDAEQNINSASMILNIIIYWSLCSLFLVGV